MKRHTIIIMTTILMISIIPAQSFAANLTTNNIANTAKTAESTEAQRLITRLNEINEIDKSTMSRVEKSELRKEVQSIKSNLNRLGEGVYLSVGAIIIIILLLILLF